MCSSGQQWRRPLSDRGSAAVEIILLSVVLLPPLVYLAVALGAYQRAALAVTAAAREAGRAYVTAPNRVAASERAERAAAEALEAMGLPAGPSVVSVTGDLRRGGDVRAEVACRVPLLPLPGFDSLGPVELRSVHVEKVDLHRSLEEG